MFLKKIISKPDRVLPRPKKVNGFTKMSQMLQIKKQCKQMSIRGGKLLPDNLMRNVLCYLSNVSPCLAVSTELVPSDYVTFLKVLPNFEPIELPLLLTKRKTITSVEFSESAAVTSQFLSNLVFFHTQIKTVVLRDVFLRVFPYLDSRETKLELNGNRWINRYKERTVEFVFEDGSVLLDNVHNTTPDEIIVQMFEFFEDTSYFDLSYYKELVPFFQSVDTMLSYREVFTRPTCYSIGAEKVKGDSAAILVCTDVLPNRHFIANFIRLDNTWKLSFVINNCSHHFWNSYEV